MLSNGLRNLGSGVDRVNEMGLNLVQEANLKGLAVGKPVRLNVMGNAKPDGSERWIQEVIISFEQPATSAQDTLVWVNATTNQVFKSIPTVRSWDRVTTRHDLFTI